MKIDRERVLSEVRVRPRSAQELLDRLGGGRHQKRTLTQLLRAMVRSGELEKRARRYRLPRADGLVEGTFEADAPEGGTVRTGSGRRFRVRSDGGAEPGDRVLLLPLGEPDGRRAERGEILDVLDGRRKEWIGIVHLEPAGAIITPYRDDEEWGLPVSRKNLGRARDGDVVVCRPARRGGGRGRLAGRVVEVLGRPGEPEADFRAVVWHRRLPVEFPPDVLAESEACSLPEGADAGDDSGVPYEDLRELPFVTIDPASARDHDDAVHVEARGDAFRLWVAIADVARFVPPGGALDREALRRGNSVYFPDRAIPMLPDRLSGDLCSLRAGEDRLALGVRMDVAADGRIGRKKVFRARIRSHAGLHYGQAAAAMGGDASVLPDASLAEPLERLAACAAALRRRRESAGALDFDLPSAQIELDAEGQPVAVGLAERNDAHRAIEEAMLAANRSVAEWLLAEDVPAIFRNHEPPPDEDAGDLRRMLANFGLLETRGQASLTPKELASALRAVAGRPEELLVNRAALRAMQQARYAAENRGHFALAFEAYLHFTSPIRRYADLEVHRAVLARLAGGKALDRTRGRANRLPAIATRISWRERVAMDAERDMDAIKKCVFMAKHLGESVAGRVTGVAQHGLYVTLEPWFVEGLVHVSTLDDWVEYDEAQHALVGRDSGRRYALGDRYQVLVEQADPIKGWINFSIEETLEEGPRVNP